ncbi:MAG: class I SAM-dependent methyltransferase [Melioribacteraceae bacterium]
MLILISQTTIHMFDPIKEAFSRQSEIFDEYEKGNEILKWMRSVTHKHVLRYLRKSDKILELNSGTGIDAVFLATIGFKIYCTDISEGMLNKLNEKISEFNLHDHITYQQLSFIDLDKLFVHSFDYIFSNFGGLNCIENLTDVFKHLSKILNPGGKVTLVIIPPICPWEQALFLKGKISTAFRRLNKNGVTANIEGVKFTTYYHSVAKTVKALGPNFRIIEIQGLASVSPPPYMINFPKRFPRLYKTLTRIDEKLSHTFPFNRCADHFIITAEFIPN